MKTSQGTERIQESTKTVASTCGDNFGKPEFPFTLDRPELLQKRRVGNQHFHSCR